MVCLLPLHPTEEEEETQEKRQYIRYSHVLCSHFLCWQVFIQQMLLQFCFWFFYSTFYTIQLSRIWLKKRNRFLLCSCMTGYLISIYLEVEVLQFTQDGCPKPKKLVCESLPCVPLWYTCPSNFMLEAIFSSQVVLLSKIRKWYTAAHSEWHGTAEFWFDLKRE